MSLFYNNRRWRFLVLTLCEHESDESEEERENNTLHILSIVFWPITSKTAAVTVENLQTSDEKGLLTSW